MHSTEPDSERVVVIGSGPAGAAAALFLSRAGVETLVMEAGSKTAPLGFTARARGVTLIKQKPPLRQRPDFTALSEPALELYEELAPGGLSNHWACAVPRFSEDDFRDAARAGEEQTWPIGYADLEPWYRHVEPLLNIAGGERDVARLPSGCVTHPRRLGAEWGMVCEAAEELGRSVVVMPYANGATTLVTHSATAFNAFSQLVLPAERSGRLRVLYDAHALRLEWSAAQKRVVAVHYWDQRSGREERLPCRAVIVAAGAVNSAQILLQSASADYPNGLGNQHDVLGRYLHDHPLAKLIIDIGRPVSIHPASYITRPPLAGAPPLYAAAFMQWCATPALVRSLLQGRPGKASELGFSVFGTMAPSRDDYVALERNGAKGDGRGRVLINLRHPPEALATLEGAKRDLLQMLQRVGWKPRVQLWKVEAPGSSVHYGGTCRMHSSPRFGVVDARCRVHGVPNVAVADSAVFTTGPEKNPVLTAMALAARAADLLGQELRSGAL